jgi:uncharacterized membrane protein YcaP (DUF421 family)
MGKRQLGELEPIELVVAILISNVASQPLQDHSTPLIYGLVPVLILLSCQIIISGLSLKSPRLRIALHGRPSILIENGVINQREMLKNRLALDELTMEMRQKNITDISKVRYAILETNGLLSIIPFNSQSPPSADDMSVSVKENGLPITVICDGRIINENLKILGYDDKWLSKQLKSRKINSPAQVYILNVDQSGNIYFLKKDTKS